MRKLILLISLLCIGTITWAQDFTNKGKEFWLGYGNHQQMYDSRVNFPSMDIYITSDVNTDVTVEIPGIGISQTYVVNANQLTQVSISSQAFLDQEGVSNKGIHVVSDKPVVVYAHITYQSVSGASLCLPVATLGREYYSVNYKQEAQANITNAYSWFFVVATEDNTEIEVTPTANTLNLLAGQKYTYTLQKGQVLNVLSPTDLTGSTIKSVNNGSGCKKIAVFCGSGRIGIGCAPGQVQSSDNLFQQMYPASTWGKKYLTTPSRSRPVNYYRIIRPDASSVVKLDGTIIPAASFTNNFYFEFHDGAPHVIQSDKPVLVAQYFTTQSCGEATGNGDPEMIFLSPVEQTISKVTLASMRLINPNSNVHYINAVLKNSPAALNTFQIDGVSQAAKFVTHPADPAYAYAQIQVAGPATHIITCDTPFNAIAYGFGGTESYGYSAGTNLKDLYQFVSIANPLGTVNFPSGCKNSPFNLSMTFPYQPLSIKWIFGPALNALGLADVTINSPVADSSWMVDDRTLYRYKLAGSYTITAIGTYPIIIKANNPTADGCNGEQQIDYDLEIFDRPKADFSFTGKCLGDVLTFTDKLDGLGRPIIKWFWDFKDGNTSAQKDPTHTYALPAIYDVAHWGISDIGCLSDTAVKKVEMAQPPTANFTTSLVHCEDSAIAFTNQSTVVGGTLAKWTWNYGDNSGIAATNGNPVTHTYTDPGNYTATLEVETATGCKSTLYQQPVAVYPRPVVDFQLPDNICLPKGTAIFTSLSAITDGTENLFAYTWEFGDGQTSPQKNPVYNYIATGPYKVKLTVTSNHACTSSKEKDLNTIYAQPKADFTIGGEVCIGAASTFTDKSDGKGSTITGWRWDFGNTQTSTQQDNTITYAVADTFYVSHSIVTDKGCVSDTIVKEAIVHPLPKADFTITGAVCEDKQVSFKDASAANAGTLSAWKWSFGDGNTGTAQDPTNTYANATSYNVTLEVESNKGCKSPAVTKAITVHNNPVPGFTVPQVCLLDAAPFTSTSTIADNSQGQFTYQWNFDDGNTANQASPQHQYATAKDYQVQLKVTSKDGCASTVTQPVTINGDVSRAAFTTENAALLCASKEVVIRDNSAVVSGKLIKVEIYWDYGSDPVNKTVDNNPVIGKTYTHKYPDFGTPATRSFQVRYIAYSGENCFETDPQTLTIQASPSIAFNPLAAICEEAPAFTINTVRELFGFNGTGVFSGTGVTTEGLFTPQAAKPGLHTIRYEFTAENGCTASNEQTILVNPTPVISAGPDKGLLEGGYLVLEGRATGTGLQYLWTPNTGLDDNTKLNPHVTSKEDMTYTLTVTSSDGCTASDDVKVTVLKSLVVPNTFTPNGDGINDTWKILYLESYPGCTVDVFNRQGQRVYTSVGYSKEWNGTVNGNPLPVGTYYWIINPKNGRSQMNGTITIIR